MAGEKTRNSGQWTEARFNSFIKSALRKARWPCKYEAKRLARIERGKYKCACCGAEGPATLPPKEGRKRRRNNAAVDHINPVIDPAVGFVDWDTVIERMFCEVEGFQVLCWECHEAKTAEERAIAVARRRAEKLVQQEEDGKV